jgi:hypothetical protein
VNSEWEEKRKKRREKLDHKELDAWKESIDLVITHPLPSHAPASPSLPSSGKEGASRTTGQWWWI